MKAKRILSLALLLLLLVNTAFAAEYTYGSGENYTKTDIVRLAESIFGKAGVVEENEPEPEKESGGYVYLSADAFVIGGGFVIEPTKIAIEKGDTAASALLSLAVDGERLGDFSGTETGGFYIHSLRAPSVSMNMSQEFISWLRKNAGYFEAEGWMDGYLGEFDITDLSGWMFFLNGEPASEGMSDTVLKDGYVITLRFTVAGGMDMGGEAFGDVSEPYISERVNMDEVIKAIADGKLRYSDFAGQLNRVDLSQGDIDAVLRFA